MNERWNRGHPKPVVSAPCQPTVLTPVGLAMWRPMAEALGWPGKPVSLRSLIELANDPEGWNRYGHPEWGRLRLGHTHPQYSSAGLLFLAQAIYATTGKTTGITAQDIYAPEVEAATLFLDFLRGDRMQAMASAYYVRPFAGGANPGGGLTVANGTDPAATPETVPDLDIPSPQVGEAIIDQFLTTKRKATVLVVFDTSGSMQGPPIKTATESTAEFLSRLQPRDRVGIMDFSTRVSLLQPIAEVSGAGERAQGMVRGLNAEGDTNLYGAVCQATRLLADEAARDREKDENRLYGIVLLSDGADTVGEVSETRMFQTCMLSRESGEGPKIFVISFGQRADVEVLTRLAAESNGAVFAADPASIGQAYLRISAEQ